MADRESIEALIDRVGNVFVRFAEERRSAFGGGDNGEFINICPAFVAFAADG